MARDSSPSTVVETLGGVVKISRQFLRSIRIDSDIGKEGSLSGYICQGTARSLLESMARQIRDTQQRAFTWTGPYGGGKSSLALLLCSLVGSSSALRARAKEVIGPLSDSAIPSAFKASGDGWLVLPVVGKRGKVSEALGDALSTATKGASKKRYKEPRDLIDELKAASAHHQGVLVVIDELGKFLESAAQDGEDVYFFQELAEAASRAPGRLVVVGILHQSFDAYAARLGRQARDDWAKIQGRFVDIPLVAATDEMVELIGRAIEVDPSVDSKGARPFAAVVANSVRERRPGTPPGMEAAIARCWPLHPVVASLLGPISRRRFSQNERSTFGFLASREPLGFMEFLDGSKVDWASMYGPSRYWDYLRANVEQAILASPDGHRWAVGSEAVERAEARGTSLHIDLTKCVALIEMFRTGSGLVPEVDVLGVCVQGASSAQVQEALQDLVGWKILIERKHLGAYGVFAGSDFDIEAAVNQSRSEIGSPDFHQIAALADLQPIVAKRLYHETGTMRWFTRRIVGLGDVAQSKTNSKRDSTSVGEFLLCLPDVGTSLASAKRQVREYSLEDSDHVRVLSVPENANRIAELSLELVACERVLRTRPELEGDSVARKELMARTSAVKASLEDELGDAFALSKWYWQGEVQDSGRGSAIAQIASLIAEKVFPETPRIHSELINREAPSSNSNKARKDLMYRMVNHAGTQDLGYTGFPADAGLYYSVIKHTGLHRERETGQWGFGDPLASEGHGALFQLWFRTQKLFLQEGTSKALSDLYEYWAAPPYGVRKGIMPILGMAFFLAHRSTLALYVDGVFTPDLSEALIDEWLLDPKRVTLKYVAAASDQRAYMQAVAASIPQSAPLTATSNPLDVARALVGLVVGLPNWTRRTNNLTPQATAIRGMLLKANDPNKVLFADLPTLLDARDAEEVLAKLGRVTEELVSAYPKILNEVKTTVLKALDQADGDAVRLRARAKVVKGIAGEFRLEAFVARLETYDGSEPSIEGLLSLGSDKPPAQWVDRDVDRALLQLASWAHDFRRAETLAPLRGRPSTRRAIGVVFGGGLGREASTSFDIDDKDSTLVSKLAGRLIADLQNQPRELALAALAEAGALLVNAKTEEVI